MKLLLYCTKAKGVLRKLDNYFLDKHNDNYYWEKGQTAPYNVNGKIVAECDFEVENIYLNNNVIMGTETLNSYDLVVKSKVEIEQMRNYLKGKNGYAIHIKKLHIFDKPRELKIYSRYLKVYDDYAPIEVAPQNMMYAFEWDYDIYYDKCILISIQPQWLCKILNGEKTIEVRKKVLKEMIK